MSPELETLDQLLAGGISLTIIKTLYPDANSFMQGVIGLLTSGDVRLLANGNDVPAWRWQQLLSDQTVLTSATLRITDQGVRRIA
jgi:hypothetical protein